MHCLVRDNRLESDTGGQKNGQIYKNRNSTVSLYALRVLELIMNIDEDKIDEAALALMYLTLHDHFRAWKQIDWEVTNRLHEKGLICDPVGKAKSVVLTDEGLKKSEELFHKLFTKS